MEVGTRKRKPDMPEPVGTMDEAAVRWRRVRDWGSGDGQDELHDRTVVEKTEMQGKITQHLRELHPHQSPHLQQPLALPLALPSRPLHPAGHSPPDSPSSIARLPSAHAP